jgi:hypothetical protein
MHYKKAVEPMTAPNATIGFFCRVNQTTTLRMTETTAKNQSPLDWM